MGIAPLYNIKWFQHLNGFLRRVATAFFMNRYGYAHFSYNKNMFKKYFTNIHPVLKDFIQCFSNKKMKMFAVFPQLKPI